MRFCLPILGTEFKFYEKEGSIMKDNSSAYNAAVYDEVIAATIPFYNLFHDLVIEFVQSAAGIPGSWLDTGCGTGNLYQRAKNVFPDTHFTLADPSEKMIEKAGTKVKTDHLVSMRVQDTQGLDFENDHFDVITAIQCHHYLDEQSRQKAVENCFRMLKPGGILITFENIKPLAEKGLELALKRWEEYQIAQGKTPSEASQNVQRYGKEYFPITITQHINLLNDTGFGIADILWASYMQAGFYGIK